MDELKMQTLLVGLTDLGVTGVKVKYDGGGDSGAIEWIGYTTEKCDTPEDVNDTVEVWDNDSNLAKLDSNAYSLIEDFAQEKILNDIEDWWNNDGGYGVLNMFISQNTYSIESHIYITETEDYHHEGDLIKE